MPEDHVFPIVNCADLVRSTAWYQRVLGGVVEYRYPDEGDAEFLTLRIGSGLVGLGHGNAPAMYGETPRPAMGHAVDLCVYVRDLDRVVADAGDDVAVVPAVMPWGERLAYLRDPEGTMLLVIQSGAGTQPDQAASHTS
ncbi:glyoxalase/bleomycin resistance/extradiol dioxygenase family protein [Nostocoides sp. F2B08]|uniref:VOC family protein n=1 Tax=Nostocoides sp. F2B08 TaxID=2653936 RepID=UPI001D03FE64|nr:VOC family protein [Tetrasphaera sp. F2B08]